MGRINTSKFSVILFIPLISQFPAKIVLVFWIYFKVTNQEAIFSMKKPSHCWNLLDYRIKSYPKCETMLLIKSVSYTHLRAHETRHDLVCRLLLEKKIKK